MSKLGLVGFALCTVLQFVSASPASAQSGVVYAGPAKGDAAPDPAELESRAQSMLPNPRRYGEAAKLYLRAADLRKAGDPRRVTDLVMASRLTYYDRNVTRARAIMERAADEALAAGDVVSAAHAYVDASFLAWEAGDNESVPRLVKKAELLASSPLLAERDRAAILARITA
jgi:hypothetical protein